MDQDPRAYPTRPFVGIGIVVLTGEAVLLVRRGRPPAFGTWSLPGGAQELGETAEQAARRELAEETGLAVGSLTLAANVDSIHHDECGRLQYHYTILDFAARYEGGDIRCGSDVTEVAWAPLDGLDGFGLWHEAHRVIALARKILADVPAA